MSTKNTDYLRNHRGSLGECEEVDEEGNGPGLPGGLTVVVVRAAEVAEGGRGSVSDEKKY